MKIKKGHDCGSCQYFLKLKDFGLCQFFDGRTNSDHGHGCKYWKAIPYKDRLKYRKEAIKYLKSMP